jgi:hypothetical protein
MNATSCPCFLRDLTKISPGTYVRRWPIWHLPLAYGSPQVTRTGLSDGKFDMGATWDFFIKYVSVNVVDKSKFSSYTENGLK